MKDTIAKKFNIYCDESRVENLDSRYMVIGALFVSRLLAGKIKKEINKILDFHKFYQELKWNKTGGKYLKLYKDIIDFFLKNNSLHFRCIIVDKKKVRYEVFHENDKELAFFKFYYLMLRNRLNDNNQYYIFLDKKPTRDKNRARSLNSFLNSYVLLRRNNCNIKHLQAYNSEDNIIIQLADFLTGLIAFRNNSLYDDKPKSLIAEYFENKSGVNLKTITPNTSQKINLFIWDPKT